MEIKASINSLGGVVAYMYNVREWYKELWIYRRFICIHFYNGQVKAYRKKHSKANGKKVRHYTECLKCGKKEWIA